MSQIFWEQIRNELPGAGEFLTGSLNVSGSFSTSGSLTVDLDGVEDIFSISVAGEEKVKINSEGVTQLISQSSTPTAVQGGIYYSSDDNFYFGFNN
jgi:hypothetical protein